MHSQHTTVLALAAAVFVRSTIALTQPPHYSVSYVDTTGDLQSQAMSRNGLVTVMLNNSGSWGAFLWQSGTLTTYPAPPNAYASGYGVNDSGIIVGEQSAAGIDVPFIADPTNGLRTFSPLGGQLGIAYDINNAGVVVGGANTAAPGGCQAFRWHDGQGIGRELPSSSMGNTRQRIYTGLEAWTLGFLSRFHR